MKLPVYSGIMEKTGAYFLRSSAVHPLYLNIHFGPMFWNSSFLFDRVANQYTILPAAIGEYGVQRCNCLAGSSSRVWYGQCDKGDGFRRSAEI